MLLTHLHDDARQHEFRTGGDDRRTAEAGSSPATPELDYRRSAGYRGGSSSEYRRVGGATSPGRNDELGRILVQLGRRIGRG